MSSGALDGAVEEVVRLVVEKEDAAAETEREVRRVRVGLTDATEAAAEEADAYFEDCEDEDDAENSYGDSAAVDRMDGRGAATSCSDINTHNEKTQTVVSGQLSHSVHHLHC